MSLVAVTKDHLTQARSNTLAQERKIDVQTSYARWRMGDATRVLMVERLAGLAFLPVALFWGLLTASLTFSLGVSLLLFRGLSRICSTFSCKKPL